MLSDAERRQALPEALTNKQLAWVTITSGEAATVFLQAWTAAGHPKASMALLKLCVQLTAAETWICGSYEWLLWAKPQLQCWKPTRRLALWRSCLHGSVQPPSQLCC